MANNETGTADVVDTNEVLQMTENQEAPEQQVVGQRLEQDTKEIEAVVLKIEEELTKAEQEAQKEEPAVALDKMAA
jgi:hypothetical protein